MRIAISTGGGDAPGLNAVILFESARNLGIDAIITIGGHGTLAIAQRLHECGMKIVGVPKTIDNDVSGTVTTFGFDTAVNTALEAIDKLHTTAESHDRVIVSPSSWLPKALFRAADASL